MNAKHVRLSFPLHKEDQPFVVRLTHIPTGTVGEAADFDIDKAMAEAEKHLEEAIATNQPHVGSFGWAQ